MDLKHIQWKLYGDDRSIVVQCDLIHSHVTIQGMHLSSFFGILVKNLLPIG
ncbi:hypothetical protein Scep_029030 [Stephania cephalantha]|uniref:Uncharacterized protein n=1 Tax=Stephania cephalantha TaxID=152367 RepID=A0AAP0EIA5_9MAGN